MTDEALKSHGQEITDKDRHKYFSSQNNRQAVFDFFKPPSEENYETPKVGDLIDKFDSGKYQA